MSVEMQFRESKRVVQNKLVDKIKHLVSGSTLEIALARTSEKRQIRHFRTWKVLLSLCQRGHGWGEQLNASVDDVQSG
jgi:hypothetical protein